MGKRARGFAGGGGGGGGGGGLGAAARFAAKKDTRRVHAQVARSQARAATKHAEVAAANHDALWQREEAAIYRRRWRERAARRREMLAAMRGGSEAERRDRFHALYGQHVPAYERCLYHAYRAWDRARRAALAPGAHPWARSVAEHAGDSWVVCACVAVMAAGAGGLALLLLLEAALWMLSGLLALLLLALRHAAALCILAAAWAADRYGLPGMVARGVHTAHVWCSFLSHATQRRRIAESQTMCIICFDDFADAQEEERGGLCMGATAPAQDGDEAARAGHDAAMERKRTLACGHTFHAECIGPWIELRHTCPLCQTPA